MICLHILINMMILLNKGHQLSCKLIMGGALNRGPPRHARPVSPATGAAPGTLAAAERGL